MCNSKKRNGAALAAAAVQRAALFVAVALVLLNSGAVAAGENQDLEAGDAPKDEPPEQQQKHGTSHPQQSAPSMSSQPHHQPHASFLTMDKKAHLSGMRIEPVEFGEEGFVGYNEKGVSIVDPSTPVRVVLFGSYLDDIVLIGFTPDENCSHTPVNVHQEDFTIQTEKRIVIIYEFEKSKTIYKICLRQKVNNGNTELPYSLVDDLRCSVSTDIPPRTYYFPIALQMSIIFVLLVLSGLFSGLNLGLMSLTPQELTLISNSGSLKERKYAQTILPVRKSGNLLLCSLLIGNVCVNSAISILFDDLTSGYVALVVSSAGIVIFGEIFPQALCVKKGLAVGAHTIWVTRFFMVLTFPLAYPISLVLDKLLGHEVVSYDRKRLMELIKLSTKNATVPSDELKIAIGAFEMGDKTVRDVMTKIDDVFMIPQETVLNAKVVAEILRSGYTRIPVYEGTRDNITSLLFVKDLALLDPDDNFMVKTVCDYYQHPVRTVSENTPLRTMLEEFKKGDYHMALVEQMVKESDEEEGENKEKSGEKKSVEKKSVLVGLVTLEDIVEEILQAEIMDETDVVTDNVHRTRRRHKNHRRDLDLFIDEGGICEISMQMQLVTIQYLEGNFRAFRPDRIAQSILKKVIRAHVHKVEVSHLTDLNDPNTALPRMAKLYTKKQTSDKFVLVLEGRALVTIGQNEMTFEVGPWQCFGTELLKQLDQLIDMVDPHNTNGGGNLMPAATVSTIKTVTSAAAMDKIEGGSGEKSATTGGNNRTSHGMLPSIMASTQQQPLVDLIGQDAIKKIKFIPDYSVKILSECTYLEINVQTYIAMYRSTLITRNKEGVEGNTGNAGGAGGTAQAEEQQQANSNGTATTTAVNTPQHNQSFELLAENLVDTAPLDLEQAEQLGKQPQMDGIVMKAVPRGAGKTAAVGNGAVGGGQKKRMDDSQLARHRRTNSDTMTGLLPNGTRMVPAEDGNEEGEEEDVESGLNRTAS